MPHPHTLPVLVCWSVSSAAGKEVLPGDSAGLLPGLHQDSSGTVRQHYLCLPHWRGVVSVPLSLWPLACVLLVLPLSPLVGERRRPSRPRCPCRAPSPVSSGLTHNRPLSLGRQMARSVTSEVQPHRARKGDQCVCVCVLYRCVWQGQRATRPRHCTPQTPMWSPLPLGECHCPSPAPSP